MGTLNQTTRELNNNTRSALHLTQAESIVGDGTYKSPGTYVTEIDPALTENIDYSGGSAVYTGLDDIQIQLIATISIKSTSANVDVTMTGGIESTPDVNYEIENKLTSANEVKELTNVSIHTWSTGETLDFFIKASSNITMEKAIWIISRYDN